MAHVYPNSVSMYSFGVGGNRRSHGIVALSLSSKVVYPLQQSATAPASATTRSLCPRRIEGFGTKVTYSKNGMVASASSYESAVSRPIDPSPSAFSFVCLVHGICGIAMAVFPENILSEVYLAASGNTLVNSLMCMMGGMHLYAALLSHCLVGAAEHGRLTSNTYKRLAYGVAAWSFFEMAKIAFVSSASHMVSLCGNVYAGIFALTLGTMFMCSKGMRIDFVSWNPLKIFSLGNIYGFAAISSVFAFTTVWYRYFLPDSFLGQQLGSLSWIQIPAGALGWDLIQSLSIGAFLLYSSFVTLLDASQRNRLGASTFKLLNLGTGLLSILWGFCLYRLFSEGSAKVLCLGEIFTSFETYSSHLMDILTFKMSFLFPVAGLVCLWQWFVAKK